jgi:hypothetical protein
VVPEAKTGNASTEIYSAKLQENGNQGLTLWVKETENDLLQRIGYRETKTTNLRPAGSWDR